MSTQLASTFLFSFLFLLLARKVARKNGLVDRPNFRKRHQGLIPLVGGISVYAGVCFTFLMTDDYIPHARLYLVCAGILVVVGALDDRYDISVRLRATVQAAVAAAMMGFAGLTLQHLGYIFGDWNLSLGPFNYLLTLFAVWAAINAFNMVDGIDGLLGGLSSVSFGAIGILLYHSGNHSLALWSFSMIAATLPYILLNLGAFGRRYKVFMGDAGSTMLREAARTTFALSRFRTPWYAPEDSGRFYARWVENAVLGTFDDVCLVLEDSRHRPEGWVTLRQLPEQEARIGLLAAWPGQVGRGTGRRLMQAAEAWCRQQDVLRLRVATQLGNIAALRLYLGGGARIDSTAHWLYR